MTDAAAPTAILTDIEGTTTDVRFVHDVLFPYAARALPDYLRENAERAHVAHEIEAVRRRLDDPAASIETVTETLLRWIADDLKEPALKTLQGYVWETGYLTGELVAPIYPDAVEALRRWREEGRSLYVYSSGSETAQKLLFGNSEAGDLTELFSGWFDTSVGGKKEAASYRLIAERLALAPENILFLSDHPDEIDAALAAGMKAVRIDRERAPDAPPAEEDGQIVLGGFLRVDPDAERGVAPSF